MCRDALIDDATGDCRLVLDRQHADFISLVRACPGTDENRFTAKMVAGDWRIVCDAGPTGSGPADDLPDIKPF